MAQSAVDAEPSVDFRAVSTFLQAEIGQHPDLQQLLDHVVTRITELASPGADHEEPSRIILEMAKIASQGSANEESTLKLKQLITALIWFCADKFGMASLENGEHWPRIGVLLGLNKTLYRPGDAKYESLRQQYATTSFPDQDLFPEVISAVKNVQGIIETLEEFSDPNQKFSIRTGGHQYCGFSSTGGHNVQIDLADEQPFVRHEYNREANVLISGVSYSLQKWAEKNARHGIFLPMGECSNVHLGGHVHTGGLGQHSRGHGYLLDHVLAFTTVLADCRKLLVIRPSFRDDEKNNDLVEEWKNNSDGFRYDDNLNNDLFFATLGGSAGGDMGIVTEFYFRPVRDEEFPNSVGWSCVWLYEESRLERMLQKLSQFAKAAENDSLPGDFDVTITVFKNPPLWPRNSPGYAVLEDLQAENMLGASRVPLPWCMIILYMSANEERDCVVELANEMINAGGWWYRLVDKKFNEPLSKMTFRWVMSHKREFQYPYIRAARATTKLLQPEKWVNSATGWTNRIVKRPMWWNHLALAAQFQVYGGNNTAIARHDNGETAIPLRKVSIGVTFPIFYSGEEAKRDAQDIRTKMHEAWVGRGSESLFGEVDFRVFAFTWGERNLTKIWKAYYQDAELYQRVREIKASVDPQERFRASSFSLSGV